MPINPHLADRIRRALQQRQVVATEKRMMGGLCFMVDGKMCVGLTSRDELLARIQPDPNSTGSARLGCREMEINGRRMRGFFLVQPEAYDTDADLAWWVDGALAYNPLAPRSPKKKPKT